MVRAASKKPKRKEKTKTYAWNFRALPNNEGALVLRAISSDSIGVIRMNDEGSIEFWANGIMQAKTKSLAVLFKAIDRIERRT